ncbi:hypothetical protein ACFL1G_11160 [Planctomycetota bacterium]
MRFPIFEHQREVKDGDDVSGKILYELVKELYSEVSSQKKDT